MLYSTLHTNPELGQEPEAITAAVERDHRIRVINTSQRGQLILSERAARSMVEDEFDVMHFALVDRIKATFGPYFLKEVEGERALADMRRRGGYHPLMGQAADASEVHSGHHAMSVDQLFGPLKRDSSSQRAAQRPTSSSGQIPHNHTADATLPALEGAYTPENWSRSHFIAQVPSLPPVRQLHHEQIAAAAVAAEAQAGFPTSSKTQGSSPRQPRIQSAKALQQQQFHSLRAASASVESRLKEEKNKQQQPADDTHPLDPTPTSSTSMNPNPPLYLRSPIRPDSGIKSSLNNSGRGGRRVILSQPKQPGVASSNQQLNIYDPETERKKAKEEQLRRLVVERDAFVNQQHLLAYDKESEAEKDYYRIHFAKERKRAEHEATARELSVMTRRNEQDSMYAAKAFVAGWERRERTELEREFEAIIVPKLWQLKTQVLEEGRRAEYDAFLNTDEQKELAAQKAKEEKLLQSTEAKRKAAFEREQYAMVHDCKHSRTHQSVFIGSLAKKMCLMCKVKFDEKMGIYVKMR